MYWGQFELISSIWTQNTWNNYFIICFSDKIVFLWFRVSLGRSTHILCWFELRFQTNEYYLHLKCSHVAYTIKCMDSTLYNGWIILFHPQLLWNLDIKNSTYFHDNRSIQEISRVYALEVGLGTLHYTWEVPSPM